MDIKKPVSNLPVANMPKATPAALQSKEKLQEAVPQKPVEQMTDMERHVAGFVDLPLSEQKGEFVVTAPSTQNVLEAMGIRVESSGVFDVSAKLDKHGGELLTNLFAKQQGHGGKDAFVETDRLAEVGVRDTQTGIKADTGMFDKKTGMINAEKAASWWVETGGGKPFLTIDDVTRYINGKSVDVLGLFSLHKPGKAVNELELRLLFDLAAVVDKSGQKVLTQDRFLAFLDGSLWRGLAEARKEGKLYEPVKVGEAMHGSARKVASEIAKLTARYGFSTDAGTQALHQAQLTIDTDASLKYQQSEKTMLPTVLGAVRALCPVGGAAALKAPAKPAELPAAT